MVIAEDAAAAGSQVPRTLHRREGSAIRRKQVHLKTCMFIPREPCHTRRRSSSHEPEKQPSLSEIVRKPGRSSSAKRKPDGRSERPRRPPGHRPGRTEKIRIWLA